MWASDVVLCAFGRYPGAGGGKHSAGLGLALFVSFWAGGSLQEPSSKWCGGYNDSLQVLWWKSVFMYDLPG